MARRMCIFSATSQPLIARLHDAAGLWTSGFASSQQFSEKIYSATLAYRAAGLGQRRDRQYLYEMQSHVKFWFKNDWRMNFG